MGETKYNFQFNFTEVSTLVKACKELPYKESANLINYIVANFEKQAKENELAAKKAKETEEDSKTKEISDSQN